MASITNRPNSHIWIQYSVNGKRHTLRLGKTSASIAQQVKANIEELVDAHNGTVCPSRETWFWVERVSDRIHHNLAQAGLVSPRDIGRTCDQIPTQVPSVPEATLRKSTDDRPGVIYFLEALGIGKVKIGWTSMPHRRINELKLMSPVLLRPLAFRPGSRSDEARLHHQLAAFRSWGEWFLLTDLVRQEIDKVGTIFAGNDWENAAYEAMPNLTAREFYELFPEKLKKRRG